MLAQVEKERNGAVATEGPLTENQFTEELTALCLRHGVGLEGAQVWEMDKSWDGPDADIRARYAIAADGSLVRTF